MEKIKKGYSLIIIAILAATGFMTPLVAYAYTHTLRVPMNQISRIYVEMMEDNFEIKFGEKSYNFKVKYVISEDPIPEFIKIDKISNEEFIINIRKADPEIYWSRETIMKMRLKPMSAFGIPINHPSYKDFRGSIIEKIKKIYQLQFGYSDQQMELFYKHNTCSSMQEKVRSLLSGAPFSKPPYEGADSAALVMQADYSDLQTFGAIYSIIIGFISRLSVDINSLADLGSGEGTFLLCAQEHLSPEMQFYGYDNNPLYFGYDFRGYLKEIAPRLNLIQSDLNDPNNPIWNRMFDVVTTNHVLEHIVHTQEEAQAHLEAWNKIAGKYLIVSVPFEGDAPTSPNHTISFHKSGFVSICQNVARENGYHLVLDFLDWGIVIFEHPFLVVKPILHDRYNAVKKLNHFLDRNEANSAL